MFVLWGFPSICISDKTIACMNFFLLEKERESLFSSLFLLDDFSYEYDTRGTFHFTRKVCILFHHMISAIWYLENISISPENSFFIIIWFQLWFLYNSTFFSWMVTFIKNSDAVKRDILTGYLTKTTTNKGSPKAHQEMEELSLRIYSNSTTKLPP